jgi:DNA-binding NtrC family response regulator
MEKVSILYFGKHPEISATVIRLINSRENWTGKGVSDIAAAINLIRESPFNIILLGCGIPEPEELQFKDYLRLTHPAIKVIQHYGGGSGLLFNEILEALHNSPAIA